MPEGSPRPTPPHGLAGQLSAFRKLLTYAPQKSVFQTVVVVAAIVTVAGSMLISGDLRTRATAAVLVVLLAVVTMLLTDKTSRPYMVLCWITVVLVGSIGVLLVVAVALQVITGTPGAAPPPPPPLQDATPKFAPTFFWQGPGFFENIREEYQLLKAKDVTAERHIWVHYITEEYQLGFQAYLGLRIAASASGTIPLRVAAANAPADTEFHYVHWQTGMSHVSMRHATFNELTVTPDGFKNAFVFRYYPDTRKGSDWFTMATSEFHKPDSSSQTLVQHVAIVRNADLAKWNPNKYLLEVDPRSKVLSFSSLVYRTYMAPVANRSAELQVARDILARFQAAIPDLEPGHRFRVENYDQVKARLHEVFGNGEFNPNVTIFLLETAAFGKDLVCVYRFRK